MKITIIKDDQAVYEDGVAVAGISLADLPNDFHALQWNGSSGEIEWEKTPNQLVSSENEIESAIGVSLTTIRERRNARVAYIQSEMEKQLAKA
jgi:hypothetical protein